jgi:hypothetical protein
MALKKTVQTPQGFNAVDAYHRVEGVRLQSKNQIAFQLRSYKDSNSVVHFNDALHVCAYELNGSNPLAQAYAHIKTLSEFADSVDC